MVVERCLRAMRRWPCARGGLVSSDKFPLRTGIAFGQPRTESSGSLITRSGLCLDGRISSGDEITMNQWGGKWPILGYLSILNIDIFNGSKTSIRGYPKNFALFRYGRRRPPLSQTDRPISIFYACCPSDGVSGKE